MILAVAAIWAMLGGERVTSEGTAEPWACARVSESPLLGALGLGADEADGPDGVEMIEITRRRRYAATVVYRADGADRGGGRRLGGRAAAPDFTSRGFVPMTLSY